MYSRPRPRRIVSSNVLRMFRVAGWRYSSQRRAWVFAPLSGRIGPVLRLSESHRRTNTVTIASNDLWMPSTAPVVAPLPRRLRGASRHHAPLRFVATPVPAAEPPVALSGELELKLQQELAAASGAKAAPAPRAQPAPPVEQAGSAEPASAGTRWPFLVGPSTIRAVASGPALTLVPAASNRELGRDAASADAPVRLPQRINPASRGASVPAPAPTRNAARRAPLLPGEPRSG